MESKVRKRAKSQPKASQEQPDVSTSNATGFRLKYVIAFLILLFIAVFFGTYCFLGSLGIGYDTVNEMMNGNFLSDNDLTSTTSKADQKPVIHERPVSNTKGEDSTQGLTLPTIVWWTDKLFPHFQGKQTVEISCEYEGVTTKCLATTEKKVMSDPLARGVMFYGSDFRAYEAPLPRRPWHEWALLHEESPLNNQILSHAIMMELFNHTATFRRESHFPLTTQHLKDLQYLTKRKPVPIEVKNRHRSELAPVVYIQTHCRVPSDRDRYVKELMKYIDVDSYGKCVNNKKLPKNLQDPVESMDSNGFYDFIGRYKFHLAFENGICEDYITEKLYRPLHVGSVPIYRGSSSVRDWAPSNHSVIVVDDFDSPKELAEFIKRLDENDEEYLKYLDFKYKGIFNDLLRNTMAMRPWGVNEWRKPSFINAFECHLCRRIVQRIDVELAHEDDPSIPLLPPTMGQFDHVGCPEPEVSVGDMSRVGKGEDLHFWREDYWSAKDQAKALKRMIEKGATDSSKLFNELQSMFNE